MAGIYASISNITELIATLYPGFIILFLLLVSLFNNNIIKGIIYFSGIAISHIIWILLSRLFNVRRDNKNNGGSASLTCDILNFPSLNYKVPSRVTMITSFTLIYLLLPMFINHKMLFNPIMIFVLSLLTLLNMYYQYKKHCSTIVGLLFGSFLGLVMGGLWFLMLWSSGNKQLLFYNELASNNIICNKPATQTFKCSVHKNGEVISSSIV